ncbi:MAG: GNAT family N-acetyltransferase [Chloroflexi bacterium]|nr:GNAT family N-acetyltransferase [Chloroflexota bacterium]
MAAARIIVREAREEDFDALLRLLEHLDESMYAPSGDPGGEQRADVFRRILVDPWQRLLVAEDGGRIVGSAHLMVLQHFDNALKRSGVVEGVVVDEAYRGKGVGAALMRGVAEMARKQRCYKLALTSNLARSGAHRFYSRLGWKRSHSGYSLEL